jgi:hypothetical protein
MEVFVLISPSATLTGSYDYGEVARSIFIAIAASYAALDLAGRVTAARGRARSLWLAGGAIAMGIGIWAMHFKGMLAFRLPAPAHLYLGGRLDFRGGRSVLEVELQNLHGQGCIHSAFGSFD